MQEHPPLRNRRGDDGQAKAVDLQGQGRRLAGNVPAQLLHPEYEDAEGGQAKGQARGKRPGAGQAGRRVQSLKPDAIDQDAEQESDASQQDSPGEIVNGGSHTERCFTGAGDFRQPTYQVRNLIRMAPR